MIKRSRLIAAVLLLLLSLACFISAPVLAEGPWDGDARSTGDEGGGGIDADTTIDGDDSDGNDVFEDDGQGDSTDWDWVIVKTIFRIIFISITQGSTSSASFN